jgi:predicted DNA binding protein
MLTDKNNVIVEIGDIVKIENSPIKSDNAVYVVGQDGTSKNYTGKDLTMYKVAKHKEGYSLSKSSYNICFYPLCNYSNKYHYTREEMNAATIEVLIKADNTAFNLVKSDDKYEAEETEETYYRAVVKNGDEEIEDTSYPSNQKEKMIAFFSNITLKQGETIEICKQDYSWNYYNRNVSYKLESTKPVKEEAEATKVKDTITETETNGLHYEIKEDIDTRDNSKLYVVKVVEKLSRDEYLTVNNNMKSIGGYYSKFKHSFVFKVDPTELLNGDIKQEEYNINIEQSKNNECKNEEQTTHDKEIKQPQPEKKKSIDFEIEQSQHTKTKELIWLVKVKSILSKDDFAEVKRNFATLKGFYSSFNNSFIFKYNPSEKLQTSV